MYGLLRAYATCSRQEDPCRVGPSNPRGQRARSNPPRMEFPEAKQRTCQGGWNTTRRGSYLAGLGLGLDEDGCIEKTLTFLFTISTSTGW